MRSRELRRRHPEFPVRSFRFGWCFVPDYSLYDDLARLGIANDASILPERGGQPVARFPVRYLRPLVTVPSRIGGLVLFPRSRTLILHDWTVIPHDFRLPTTPGSIVSRIDRACAKNASLQS